MLCVDTSGMAGHHADQHHGHHAHQHQLQATQAGNHLNNNFHNPIVTERLLAAKGLEKDDDQDHHVHQGREQQLDAQIGDGMDIGIIGENGELKNS